MVGGAVVIPILRISSGKFDSLTSTNGTSVGSAGAIVGRHAAGHVGVPRTGSTVGTTAAPLAGPPDSTKTDDFAGVILAYSARGTRGISVAGSPVNGNNPI